MAGAARGKTSWKRKHLGWALQQLDRQNGKEGGVGQGTAEAPGWRGTLSLLGMW